MKHTTVKPWRVVCTLDLWVSMKDMKGILFLFFIYNIYNIYEIMFSLDLWDLVFICEFIFWSTPKWGPHGHGPSFRYRPARSRRPRNLAMCFLGASGAADNVHQGWGGVQARIHRAVFRFMHACMDGYKTEPCYTGTCTYQNRVLCIFHCEISHTMTWMTYIYICNIDHTMDR